MRPSTCNAPCIFHPASDADSTHLIPEEHVAVVLLRPRHHRRVACRRAAAAARSLLLRPAVHGTYFPARLPRPARSLHAVSCELSVSACRFRKKVLVVMHSHWAANASSCPFSPSSTSLKQGQATWQPVHEPQRGLMPEGNCHAAEPSQAVQTYSGSSAAEQACSPLPVLRCLAHHLLQDGHSGVCAAAGAANAHSVGIWPCGVRAREGRQARRRAEQWQASW